MAAETSHSGSRLIELARIVDERGLLAVGQFPDSLPFRVLRFFFIANVPTGEYRGVHAHRSCHQFLVCVSGSVSAMVDDGQTRETFVLEAGGAGLYMPPLTWGSQFDYSEGAVLLVLASDAYDAQDYVHNYEEFLSLVDLKLAEILPASEAPRKLEEI